MRLVVDGGTNGKMRAPRPHFSFDTWVWFS